MTNRHILFSSVSDGFISKGTWDGKESHYAIGSGLFVSLRVSLYLLFMLLHWDFLR